MTQVEPGVPVVRDSFGGGARAILNSGLRPCGSHHSTKCHFSVKYRNVRKMAAARAFEPLYMTQVEPAVPVVRDSFGGGARAILKSGLGPCGSHHSTKCHFSVKYRNVGKMAAARAFEPLCMTQVKPAVPVVRDSFGGGVRAILKSGLGPCGSHHSTKCHFSVKYRNVGKMAATRAFEPLCMTQVEPAVPVV